MPYTLEVCVDSIESVLAAVEGGADRLELCSSLIEGGVTPSHSILQTTCRSLAQQQSPCKVHMLVRPRAGDFFYSDHELSIIKEDIVHAASCGAHGAVLGFLTPYGGVDVDKTTYFGDLCTALDLDLTFHRAFDVTRDQQAALNALIGCNVRRVLSSGGHTTAFHGVGQLADLVAESNGRISVMPGGGVTEDNAATICQCTGAREIHGTFRVNKPSAMQFLHPRVTFSAGEAEDAWQRSVADADAIARVKARLAALAEDDAAKEMGQESEK